MKPLLAAPTKIRTVEHHAAIDWREMPEFMRALRERGDTRAPVLEFLILTAARSGEARGARWTEVDLDKGVWTIPANRMKSGRPHRVPLSKRALAILDEMAELNDGTGLIFRGLIDAVPISNMTLAAVLQRLDRCAFTAHGFRSTFREWVGETTHHAREVDESALAHNVAGENEAAYWRSDLLEKRHVLMDEWAKYLSKPPAKVLRPKFGQRRKAAGVVA